MIAVFTGPLPVSGVTLHTVIELQVHFNDITLHTVIELQVHFNDILGTLWWKTWFPNIPIRLSRSIAAGNREASTTNRSKNNVLGAFLAKN